MYLQIHELTLDGKILADGEIIFDIPVYGCLYRGIANRAPRQQRLAENCFTAVDI